MNPAYSDKFLTGNVAPLAMDSGSDSEEFEDSDSNPHVCVDVSDDEEIGVAIDGKTAKQIMQDVKKVTLDTEHHELVSAGLHCLSLVMWHSTSNTKPGAAAGSGQNLQTPRK